MDTLLAAGGFATGVIGALVGGLALVYSRRSAQIAADSKTLATDANTLSGESNAIARDARKLAEDANAYSQRSEAREIEQHDVRWDDDWLDLAQGIYAITKRGDAPAHKVRATVMFNDQEVMHGADLIAEEGQQLRFGFPSAAAAYADEMRRRRRELREAAEAEAESRRAFLPSLVGYVPPSMPEPYSLWIRVEWVTALGTPKLHEDGSNLRFF